MVPGSQTPGGGGGGGGGGVGCGRKGPALSERSGWRNFKKHRGKPATRGQISSTWSSFRKRDGSRKGGDGSRKGGEGSREGSEGSREGSEGSRKGGEGSREGSERSGKAVKGRGKAVTETSPAAGHRSSRSRCTPERRCTCRHQSSCGRRPCPVSWHPGTQPTRTQHSQSRARSTSA